MNRATNFPNSGGPDLLSFKNTDNCRNSTDNCGEMTLLAGCDEFDQQVANAQAQLEELRQRQQKIERQKDELEQLREKQTHFQCERAEILESLQHALDVLERDYLDAEQRMEHYSRARESFSQHLSIISALRIEDFPREQLLDEMDRASITIEEAREEYQRTLTHLDQLTLGAQEISELAATSASNMSPSSLKPGGSAQRARSFTYWLRSGFAFTLPIMIFAVFSMIMMFFLN